MGYEDDEAGIVPRFSRDLFEKMGFFEEEEGVWFYKDIMIWTVIQCTNIYISKSTNSFHSSSRNETVIETVVLFFI